MDKNRSWGVHAVHDMFGNIHEMGAGLPDGRWVAAVAEPYSGNRLVAAWWVLTGRAYAVVWPHAGDIEAALGVAGPKRPKAAV